MNDKRIAADSDAKIGARGAPAKAQADDRIDVSRPTGRGEHAVNGGPQLDTHQSLAGEEDPGSALEMIPRGS